MTDETRKIIHHKSPLLGPTTTNGDTDKAPKTALILLNAPMGETPSPLLQRLWDLADIRICADGGANRLWHLNQDWIPNIIVGDLDSLQQDIRTYYEQKGVAIQCRPDQNFNDLDKALQAAIHEAQCTRCIVFGAFGGRFDQEMGCLQALYKWGDVASSSSENHPRSIWLYDDQTTAILLPADAENHIELALLSSSGVCGKNVGEGPTCGLIPLGAPCERVTTTGFQWNLSNQPTAFGGLVSTSNRIVAPTVTVVASSPLIFTAEMHCGRPNSWS
jgi:thiamine pyrophosphokinase